ncbi:type ISP restriction/modification enzyme [Hwangdonia sp.]|uniref:type ISP restriction/modification enzyme n=1 Tax=Hwangdonia sp. TaxID=1883432 RepID=UPI003AB2F263
MTLGEYVELITNKLQSGIFASIDNGNEKTGIVNQIAKKLDLTFVPDKDSDGNVCFANSTELRDDYKTSFAPIDILDYNYAVLHSQNYREKYKEFLKIDYSKVPYPKNVDAFWELVKWGGQLRQLHLLESPKTENYITSYPIDGDNVVTRKMTKDSMGFEPNVIATSQVPHNDVAGKVWINDTQYFDNVPQIAWEFYIGGYQPAQKWLMDRQGCTLTFEDILHYQKIIVALTETHRLMGIIDAIKIE